MRGAAALLLAATSLLAAPTRPAAEPPLPRPAVPQPDATSCGYPSHGTLIDPAELPVSGPHHRIYEPWSLRDRRFGTPELVGVLQRASAAVAAVHPGSVLAIADMSHRDGGPITGHRTHQSGRDVDLVYYAVDDQGRPFVQDRYMGDFDADERATSAIAPARARVIRPRRFDRARNWELVKALITDRETIVRHIFVSKRVESWLIEYAARKGESPQTIARARRIMRRPSYVSARKHNDHMHVQVACSVRDMRAGACLDGPQLGSLALTEHLGCPRVVPPSLAAALDRCRDEPEALERAECRKQVLRRRVTRVPRVGREGAGRGADDPRPGARRRRKGPGPAGPPRSAPGRRSPH